MATGIRPQLQLAVDALSLEEALRIVAKVHPHMDIVEVGTSLIFEAGLAAVESLRAKHPDKKYLADLKIMDGGKIEANSAFARGAQIVTVLAAADDSTIGGALEAAGKHGGQIMADLINTPNPAERAGKLERMGVPIVCVHTAYDRQAGGASPFAELQEVRAAVRCHVAVAGGLKVGTVTLALEAGADILVVGGGIIAQPDPREAASQIMKRIQETKR